MDGRKKGWQEEEREEEMEVRGGERTERQVPHVAGCAWHLPDVGLQLLLCAGSADGPHC